jgi:hypothetical protein
LLSWCQWLESTHLATALRESYWLFPMIEGSHILAIPASVGMVLIFDLRLLGLAFRGETAPRIISVFLRWARIGFVVMFVTGGLLFITQAAKAYLNPFFRTKLILLLLLGLNAVLYHAIFYQRMAQWELAGRIPAGAKLCGGVSLVIWIGVIVCGRTMAYQL